jgi:tRNA (guanine26-N2/guanine27-N2)-dimethyltransferase
MALDRYLAVTVVRAWRPERGASLRGWEMLAATGVRGLRLAKETGRFAGFDLTEAHPLAAQVLAENVRSLGMPGIHALGGDARAGAAGAPYDYVDLDPYGTPLPFLPTALASVRSGGLLAVTATDLMVLAGAQPAACLRLYGARPVRGWLGPEGGLRILLAAIARMAEAQGRRVRPVLAYVLGHHVRAYAELDAGAPPDPLPVSEVLGEDPALPALGGPGPYGPLWTGPLADPEFVRRLDVPPSAARPVDLARLLDRFREESGADVPFAYEPNRLAAHLGLAHPPAVASLLEGLRKRGFAAGRCHLTNSAFRTRAPRAVVEEVARSASFRSGASA